MNEDYLAQERLETFYKDKDKYNGDLAKVLDRKKLEEDILKKPDDPILKKLDDPSLKKLDDPNLKILKDLYGYASRLSSQNREKHRKIILYLAMTGTALAFCFLLYDGFAMYDLIVLCIFELLILYLILHWSNNLDSHRKYLEYRLLAESIRVQFFLSSATIKTQVTELLPWFVKRGVPWIEKVIDKEMNNVQDIEKNEDILDLWIYDQIVYNEGAIKRAEKKLKRNKLVYRIALAVTIATFFILLFFEILLGQGWMLGMIFKTSCEINMDIASGLLNLFQSHHIMLGYDQAEMIRAILKVIIGTMSAATLFIGSYYGKMSLADSIKDSERMIDLYKKIRDRKDAGEPKDELIVELARQALIENSTWYAYQNQNNAEFVFI